MKALHFGAGNIGRGFVGVLLHEAGYELVFADVAQPVIDALNSEDSYTVHEVGEQARDIQVTNFSGVNSASDPDALTEQIRTADIVTTAVGPTVLKIIAPAIARGLKARAESGAGKVAVMACENAINATDGLAEAIRESYPEADDVAIFANTAVDRIVPNQPAGQGLDVTVETYHEWAVDSTPFEGSAPEVPGITWVDDLAPYITRKLFTVNTGHAATAYFGSRAGIQKISDALSDSAVRAQVEAVLAETKALLVDKFGFAPDVQQAYIEKILTRFTNPHLPDTVDRVGRAPLRKISRHERFVGPAAELAEHGHRTEALVSAIGAALEFDVAEDAESVQLQAKLAEARGNRAATDGLVTEWTGIDSTHPLFAQLSEAFAHAS
ncbi:mannitol-1-phosphate 5-dehydrogenase [uncultured Kocuria sp.]|uniref:mannitol-1-phosphate 5-dehydrogenase n=1 Tax=uncultured Kocuria sp. TaxID=259305 RepID=UPI002596B9D0|nr:mannitol-1-phosphate 5-dehydrogenase [uncultured Kocuria sp.]MCT1367280.1 mannitol-1-phosphate 5-dehydrogenase [Rothia sp. p3-SID1597]